MTNEQMKARMEALKVLLESASELVSSLVSPTIEALHEKAHHVKALEHVFQVESSLYGSEVPLKERSMEVMALTGWNDLQIKELLATLLRFAEQLPKDPPKPTVSQGIPPPLAALFQQMTERGMDVKVIELTPPDHNKDNSCDNDDCPVHGKNGIFAKKEVPEEKKN